MKKLFKLSLNKVNFRLILFSLTIFLAINSCQKDRQDLPSQTELISEARNYFESEIINLPQLNDNNGRHLLGKIPVWDKAVIKKISIGDAVLVPIKYNTDIYTKQNGNLTSLEKLSYLMVYKDRKQNLHAEWVTLIPNATEKKAAKFIGTVEIEDWNGKFKRAFAFGVDGTVLPIYLSESSIFKQTSYARTITCYTQAWYGQNFYPGGESSVYLISTETYCFGSWGSNGQENDVEDTNDGGNGETSPTDYTSAMDCTGLVGGTAYNTSNCGCIGGTTGIPECPPDDPCAKKQGLQAQLANTTLANLKASILAKTDGKEWGAKQVLNSLSMTSGYKPVALQTNNAVDSVDIDFCWNATEGYAIGSIHDHPGGNAPDYEDVFKMIANLSDPEVAASGINGINFYKANASTTVVTSDGTYVVTVKSWTELTKSFGEWVANPEIFFLEYKKAKADYLKENPNATEAEQSSFALLGLLGKGVNLFKAEPNLNTLKPLTAYINSANKLTLSTVNCPN